jgi:oligo-1,6-glucosidase
MQWDASAHAGFTTGTPWLAVNPNHVEVNAAAQVDDPDSVFAHHRALIALRHEDAVVAHGDFTMLLPDDERVYAFERRLDGRRLLVVANLSDEPSRASVPEEEQWAAAEVVLRSGPTAEGADAEITLGPWEARILRR